MGLFSLFGAGSESGIGNSKSQQTNTTESVDASVVGADGSVNSSSYLKLDGSNNTINYTDAGAVAGGLKLAMAGVEGANAVALTAQQQTSDLMAGIFKQNAAQASNLTDAVVDLKTSDVRTLVIAGLAVVGLVAVQLFKKSA
jgi:hypothetical protein